MKAKNEKRLETLRRLRDRELATADFEAWDALQYAVRVLEGLSKGGRHTALTEEDRVQIRSKRAAGESVRQLAELYHVSETTIRRVADPDEI